MRNLSMLAALSSMAIASTAYGQTSLDQYAAAHPLPTPVATPPVAQPASSGVAPSSARPQGAKPGMPSGYVLGPDQRWYCYTELKPIQGRYGQECGNFELAGNRWVESTNAQYPWHPVWFTPDGTDYLHLPPIPAVREASQPVDSRPHTFQHTVEMSRTPNSARVSETVDVAEPSWNAVFKSAFIQAAPAVAVIGAVGLSERLAGNGGSGYSPFYGVGSMGRVGDSASCGGCRRGP